MCRVQSVLLRTDLRIFSMKNVHCVKLDDRFLRRRRGCWPMVFASHRLFDTAKMKQIKVKFVTA